MVPFLVIDEKGGNCNNRFPSICIKMRMDDSLRLASFLKQTDRTWMEGRLAASLLMMIELVARHSYEFIEFASSQFRSYRVGEYNRQVWREDEYTLNRW